MVVEMTKETKERNDSKGAFSIKSFAQAACCFHSSFACAMAVDGFLPFRLKERR